jgi:rhodanese-related sulfurtransferase
VSVPWWFPFGSVDEIAPNDLYEKIKSNGKDLQLLDVRSTGEYAEGHISNTINIPINELPSRVGELRFDSSRPVYAICLSGHRSVPAYRLLKSKGYTEVYQLAGGMLAWWAAKLPNGKGKSK